MFFALDIRCCFHGHQRVTRRNKPQRSEGAQRSALSALVCSRLALRAERTYGDHLGRRTDVRTLWAGWYSGGSAGHFNPLQTAKEWREHRLLETDCAKMRARLLHAHVPAFQLRSSVCFWKSGTLLNLAQFYFHFTKFVWQLVIFYSIIIVIIHALPARWNHVLVVRTSAKLVKLAPTCWNHCS